LVVREGSRSGAAQEIDTTTDRFARERRPLLQEVLMRLIHLGAVALLSLAAAGCSVLDGPGGIHTHDICQDPNNASSNGDGAVQVECTTTLGRSGFCHFGQCLPRVPCALDSDCAAVITSEPTRCARAGLCVPLASFEPDVKLEFVDDPDDEQDAP
jgi:hypothetical protein